MAKVKEKKEGPKLAGVKFVTPPFRLSFPHIFEPHKAPKAQKAKYSITMLFPKDIEDPKMAEEFANFKKNLRKAAREAWGKDKLKWPKIFWPERDGDEKAEYPGYEGHVYYNADSDNPPGIVDRDREEILDKAKIYPGCYCRAEVVAKAIPEVGVDDSGKPKNFVKFYLQHVMFWEDGERIGGGGDAKAAFSDYSDDDDDDSDDSDDDDEYDV